MKNIVLIVVIVVLAAGGYWWWQNQKPAMVTAPANQASPTGEIMKNETAIAGENYVLFTKDAFEKASDKRRVLFYYANWCPICRPADASFRANVSQIPSDVILFRVNFNDPETDVDEKDLARKHAVTYQHTYILVDAEGNEVRRWSGGDIEELLSNLR